MPPSEPLSPRLPPWSPRSGWADAEHRAEALTPQVWSSSCARAVCGARASPGSLGLNALKPQLPQEPLSRAAEPGEKSAWLFWKPRPLGPATGTSAAET